MPAPLFLRMRILLILLCLCQPSCTVWNILFPYPEDGENEMTLLLLALAAGFGSGGGPGTDAIGPEYLAVTSHQDGGAAGEVYLFRKSTSDCTLTALDSRTAGQNSYDIQISADGGTLYVANDGAGAGSISVYTVDYSGEALEPIQTLSVAGPGGNSVPYGMAYHSSGWLFTADGDASSGSILGHAVDANTGQLTALTPEFIVAGTRMWFATLGLTEEYLYASHYDGGTLYRYAVNAGTGALTYLGEFGVGNNPWHVNRHPSLDALYVTNYGSASVSMLAVNTGDGSTGDIGAGAVATGAQPIGLAVGESHAYAAANGGQSLTGYHIDSSTGELTAVTTESVTGFAPYGLGLDAAGSCLYVGQTDGNGTQTSADRLAVYGVNASTGALTFVESHSAGLGPRFPLVFRRR